VAADSGKKVSVLGAISDFVILILLLGGAGFGGYYYGIHQRLAPIENVPPGTPGAVTAATQPAVPAQTVAVKPAAVETAEPPAQTKKESAPDTTESPKVVDATKKTHGPKYWLASSGDDYTGYSITVSVNDHVVDNFFGPGKNVDVTRHVKSGDNKILFDAKALGDSYNKHKGDAEAALTVKLVSGPKIEEDFKPSDVLMAYTRNAAEEENFTDTKHFVKK
jgi:hypothetical protein